MCRDSCRDRVPTHERKIVKEQQELLERPPLCIRRCPNCLSSQRHVLQQTGDPGNSTRCHYNANEKSVVIVTQSVLKHFILVENIKTLIKYNYTINKRCAPINDFFYSGCHCQFCSPNFLSFQNNVHCILLTSWLLFRSYSTCKTFVIAMTCYIPHLLTVAT